MTRSHATTGLLAIRKFLNRHDSEARPWSNAPEAVDRLLAILRARRGDDAFWADLRLLANRLEDDQFDRAAARRRGVIEGDRLDSLVDELRAKLDGNGGVTVARSWIGQPYVTGAAALAFCMLGSSFGCFGGDGDDDDDGNGAAATCTDAVTQSLKGAEAEVYCDLAGLIKSSSLSTSDKADLMECLPNLGAQMRANLLDSFQNLSDAELAAELTDLLNNGLCAPYHDGVADDDTNVDDDDSWSDGDDDDYWGDDDGGH